MNRLKERYQKEIVPALMKQLDLTNVMQVPRLQKVVVNIGMGEALDNPKAIDAANGYTKFFVDRVKHVRELCPKTILMAGNVATPEMVQELLIFSLVKKKMVILKICKYVKTTLPQTD